MYTQSTAHSQTTAPPTVAPASSHPGGWTAQRREVIDRAGGVCALCGTARADTVFRCWAAADLVAAHTRCVVGLGPPTEPSAA